MDLAEQHQEPVGNHASPQSAQLPSLRHSEGNIAAAAALLAQLPKPAKTQGQSASGSQGARQGAAAAKGQLEGAAGSDQQEILQSQSSEEDEIMDDSDSDFQGGSSRGRRQGGAAAAAAGALRGRGRAAAAGNKAAVKGQPLSGSSEDDADSPGSIQEQEGDGAGGSGDADEELEGQQQQLQQQEERPQQSRRRGRPRKVTMKVQQQQQQEQEAPALRRSARTTRGALAAAAAMDEEDVPVARPRRAAANAAKAATAAALADEQVAPVWANSQATADTDSYLGTPDVSSDDEEGGEDQAAGSEDSWEDDDSGSGRPSQRRRQPVRAKRGKAAAANGWGSSDEEADDLDDDRSEGDALQDSEAAEDDDGQRLDLNDFRFDGSSKLRQQRGAAAAIQKQGRRRSSSDGSDADAEAAAAAAAASAAAIQAEEELAGQVADPCEFVPQELSRVPRDSDVEKILAVRYGEDGSPAQVLVKLTGKSYRAAAWLPSRVVESKRSALLRNFITRQAEAETEADVEDNNINPLWYQVDRIVSERKRGKDRPPLYLVKWSGLEYSDSTWEEEEEITRDGAGQVALARYKRWSAPPRSRPPATRRPRQELLDQKLLPTFKNSRALRDYQVESLHWMINNYRGQIINNKWKPRNCILGDEMGLGKTAQSISVIAWLKQYAHASAPCMVVAPLTTLGHWKREIQTWTDLNVVLYAGSAADRLTIREHEFYYSTDKTKGKVMGARFDVLLASYETILKDKSELKKVQFEALILDEAHRLKSRTSATRAALLELPVRWLLLLSGTPVQNNMSELQGLMSLLDEQAYGDADEFMEKYGADTPSLKQIRALQAELAPVLLRRMKEDVENLPEKEEVIIWVELTAEQRRYYRALYSQQIGALLGASNKNLPGMRNLAMELRKLCCHPFLCNGLEEDMAQRWAAAQAAGAAGGLEAANKEVEALTRASGKMLLLHKLLPKLRAEGRQVLIFSQFKMMLDVLEDYLEASNYPFERIDGDTKQADRQAAIDRFMAGREGSRQRSKTPKTPGGSRAASPSCGAPSRTQSGQQLAAAAAAADGAAAAAAAAAAAEPSSKEPGSRERSPPAITDAACNGTAEAAAGGQAVDGAAPAGSFVFLLSTRAGGQGITLTSADTVIIYDSDWNPQNDLQAMARCHRIGQDREVTVYRLVSRNTYEQQLFECASKKYGLDEAILGFAGAGDNPENDAARIEQLLRLGAHAILEGESGAAAAGGGDGPAAEEKGFAAEDIDQILEGRSEKRQLGSRKGNTFSVAHFGDGGGELDPEAEVEEQEAKQVEVKDAKAFWSELLPDAVANHAAALEAAKKPELLGPRRRNKVDYREASLGRKPTESDDFSALGDEDDSDVDMQLDAAARRGTKRGAADAPDGDMSGKKVKKKGDAYAVDPELGRVVAPWTSAHVEVVKEQLLRYGMDKMDTVVEKCQQAGLIRQRDEIAQLCKALALVVDEMAKVAPVLQQEEKAAREAAAAAAVAAALKGTAAAAAAEGIMRTNSHTLSSNYTSNMRDGLLKSGIQEKLPPATRKALLSLDTIRRAGRNPAFIQQQLEDHHKVHQAMVAANLVEGSNAAVKAAGTPASQPPPAAAAAAATPKDQQPQAAAGTAATPAAAAGGATGTPAADGSHKRLWVAPRVLLRGSKGLPLWWKRDDDDALIQGCYHHGFHVHGKLNAITEDILADPALGFPAKVAIDPVEAVAADAQAAATVAAVALPPNPAAAAGGLPVPAQPQQRPVPVVNPVLLERAKLQKAALQRAHPGITLMHPADWKKLIAAVVARLKRVRSALVDPNYQEPATPSKQPAPGAAAGTPAAAAAAPGSHGVQQRLQLTAGSDGSLMHRGKKVIGGGIQPLAAPVNITPVPTSNGRVLYLAGASPAQQQQLQQQLQLQQQIAAQRQQMIATVTANAMLAMARNATAAAAQAQKRSAAEALAGVHKQAANPPSGIRQGVAAAAATSGSTKQQPQQQRAATQQQQKQQHEVIVLDDDSDEEIEDSQQSPPKRPRLAAAAGAHSAGNAAGKSAPAAPSSGLVVRRVPASNDLSQEHSVDEPQGDPDGAAAATPAPGTVSSSGKQHMQQLLGSAQAKAHADGHATKPAAAEHPVYGTPAGATAAAPAAPGNKRKSKEDSKQRKLNEFFAVTK